MVANSINICVHFNLSITYQCCQNSFQAIIEIKSNCIFTFFSHIIKPFVMLLWNTLNVLLSSITDTYRRVYTAAMCVCGTNTYIYLLYI